jgi:WD40 repeat protein
VSHGDEGAVRIYQLDGAREWCRFQAPRGNHTVSLDFAPDGRRLVAGCTNGTALVWDVSDPKALAVTTLTGHEKAVRFVAFLPDSRTVATGDDREIRFWSLGSPASFPEAPAAATKADGRGGWAIGGIVALALALSLAAYFYLRRRRGRKGPAGASPRGEKAHRPAVSTASSLTCSGCGKSFTARAELAGKAVKCPTCGQVMTIPGPAPVGQSGSASA